MWQTVNGMVGKRDTGVRDSGFAEDETANPDFVFYANREL